jgi:cytochrome c oxidase assembly protein subunit 15
LSALCAIVVTGSLVRLTGSGLGCDDWPRCNEERLIDVSSGHAAIEQVNRLFTGVVSASVVLAVLMAHRLRPRRRSLVGWAWWLVAGVAAQVVLGGIVVLTGLHPLANMGHFLLSMLLVMAGTVLVIRAGQSEARPWWRRRGELPDRLPMWLLRTIVVGAAVTVVAGTVVTASGPHAGDEEAPRFGFDLAAVSRVHAVSMLVTLAAIVWAAVLVHRSTAGPARSSAERAMGRILTITVAQGAIGYWQYFAGVPAALVALHILGATLFWISVVALWAGPTDAEAVPHGDTIDGSLASDHVEVATRT